MHEAPAFQLEKINFNSRQRRRPKKMRAQNFQNGIRFIKLPILQGLEKFKV